MANKYYTAGKGIEAGGKKVIQGLKKIFSKKEPTITGMKPTTGTKDKQAYQFKLMQKKLSKNKDEMIKFRNQKSKELFKDK